MGSTQNLYSSGLISRPTDTTWDERKQKFQPHPPGPIENEAVVDRATMDAHYEGRELSFVDTSGLAYPVTSMKDHYPPKEIPAKTPLNPLPQYPFPLGNRTEYRDEYPGKNVDPRTMPPEGNFMKCSAQFDPNTTYGNHYPGHPGRAPLPKQTQAVEGDFDMGSFMKDTFTTTNHVKHNYKGTTPKQFMGQTKIRDPMPTMNDVSTMKGSYVVKPIPEKAPCPPGLPIGGTPWTSISEYTDQYIPKVAHEQCPPLTGILSDDGIPLPYPRRALGVQITQHRGSNKEHRVYELIPAAAAIPCMARQVFTTTVGDQAEACILVMYGDSPVASENDVIGQFDLKNLLPGPAGTARIELTFKLGADNKLTVDAREMDATRHKRWVQRGGVMAMGTD